MFDAFVPYAENGAALRAGGDFKFRTVFESRNLYPATERRLNHRNGIIEIQIGALPYKELMRFDGDENDRAACGTTVITCLAFVVISHALTVVDTCGNDNFKGFFG